MIPLKDLENTYSNEQLFILLITRIYFSGSALPEFNSFLASHPLDWKLLYKIAQSHSIRPFIYHVIRKHELDVDAGFKSSLENDYQAALQKNMMKGIVTARITDDLKKLGITVIAYKGFVFASQYYENLAMRESVDIDLIASRADVKKIENYFIANGYIAKETVPQSYLKFYQPFFKDIIYKVPKYDCNIEIHWSLLNTFAGSFPDFVFFKAHIKPYKTDYGEYSVLSPTYDFLATISNHFVKDMSNRFKYIIDVASLLKKHPALLDDPVILSTAKKFGFEKRLIKGLSVVNALTGVDIDSGYRHELTKEDVLVPLQYPIQLRNFQFNNIHFLKRSLRLQDNLKNKIALLSRAFCYLFIPSYIDINTFRLPVYLSPLLFILRPFRLLFEKISPASKK